MLNLESFEWEQLGSTDLLKAGHQLGEPSLLFEKIEDETIQKQLDKLEATKKANEAAQYKAAPIKDTVSFEDIAAFYENPEELIGKRILFVANFEPRKMMGIESQGMILSAVDFDESLSVVTTTKDVKPGSIVG